MKPWQVFLRIFTFFVLLGIVSVIFPKQGIKLSKNLTIRFFRIEDYLNKKKKKYTDISTIINTNISAFDSENETIYDNNLYKRLWEFSSKACIDTTPVDTASLFQFVHAIQFPENNPEILYPFFENLRKHDKLIRILHYGDSQIESDRITSYIRNKIQKQFGGSGAGLLSLVGINNSEQLYQYYSGNWMRYTLFGKNDTTIKHNKFGVLFSFSKFAITKSKGEDSTIYKSAIYFNRANIHKYKNYGIFDHLQLFYGNSFKSVKLSLIADNVCVASPIISPSSDVTEFNYHFEKPPYILKLEFEGIESPDLYAVSLDDARGIAVDNISMRGSSGLEFKRADIVQLVKMYRKLNVKLIILQFGANAAHYEDNNFKGYEYAFYSQLKLLKSNLPEIPIIVIGVPDASEMKDEDYFTYPMVKTVREQQRKAALKAGCAFWDLYEAMGGENSMPSWVFSSPPLAQKDFIHFTQQGANIVGKMFLDALMKEYNKYKLKFCNGVNSPINFIIRDSTFIKQKERNEI